MSNLTLGDVLSTHGGSIKTGPFGTALKASEYSAAGVPLISVGEVGHGLLRLRKDTPRIGRAVVARLPEYVLKTGDIVFGRKGAVDRSAWIKPAENGYFLGSDGIRVRFAGDVDPRFMAYQFQSSRVRVWLVRHAAGTTMASLNQGVLERVPVVLPPLDEQRAIAEVLGALDDKIAANKSVEATSDELVGAMYAQSVRDDAEEHPLFDVFHVDFGEAFKGASFTDPGVGRPLIRIRDLKTFTSQIWTSEERPRETVVRPGDVVVGMDAEFRATWWLGDDGLLNQRVCRVRGLDCTPALVAEALRAPLARIERYKSATTVIHLNKSDLQQAKVLMPTEANRISFEAKAQPLVDHRVSLARQRGHLARMRDALLPLLMSGKVTVRDAESVVEGVV